MAQSAMAAGRTTASPNPPYVEPLALMNNLTLCFADTSESQEIVRPQIAGKKNPSGQWREGLSIGRRQDHKHYPGR